MYLHTKYSPRIFLAPDEGATATLEKPVAADDHVGLRGAGIVIGKALADVKLEDPEKKEEPEGKVVKGEVAAKPVIPERPRHKDFEAVLEGRKKAEEALSAKQKEWEAEKAKWEDERKKFAAPPDVEPLKKELESTRAEKERIEKEFQAIVATRAVQAEYAPKRQERITRMEAIAKASGDPAVASAVARWDYDKLAEFAEDGNLTAGQKRDWNRMLDEVTRMDEEIQAKTANPDAAWSDLQKRSQEGAIAQQRERIAKNVSIAEATHAKLLETIPALKAAPELSASIRKDLVALAGGEGNERFPAETIMAKVAEHAIYENLTKQQHAKITTIEKELNEAKETIKKLKGPRFGDTYLSDDRTEKEDEHVGFFGGGIKVSTGR